MDTENRGGTPKRQGTLDAFVQPKASQALAPAPAPEVWRPLPSGTSRTTRACSRRPRSKRNDEGSSSLDTVRARASEGARHGTSISFHRSY